MSAKETSDEIFDRATALLDKLERQDDTQLPEYKAFMSDLSSKPDGERQKKIMANATKGLYSDFRSEEASPKMLLRKHLVEAGFQDMAKKVVEGLYDF